MRKTGYLLLALMAGCATPQQKAEQRAADEQQRAKEYRVMVENQCFAYGFKPNTAEWPRCLMQVDMANRQQDAARRQMIQQEYVRQQGILR